MSSLIGIAKMSVAEHLGLASQKNYSKKRQKEKELNKITATEQLHWPSSCLTGVLLVISISLSFIRFY